MSDPAVSLAALPGQGIPASSEAPLYGADNEPSRSAAGGLSPRETRSTCCYCGVGCGVIVESDGQQAVGVRGDPDHPANFGRLCTKGSTLHLSARPALQQQVRALHPEMRIARDQPRQRQSWDEVQDFMARKFAS